MHVNDPMRLWQITSPLCVILRVLYERLTLPLRDGSWHRWWETHVRFAFIILSFSVGAAFLGSDVSPSIARFNVIKKGPIAVGRVVIIVIVSLLQNFTAVESRVVLHYFTEISCRVTCCLALTIIAGFIFVFGKVYPTIGTVQQEFLMLPCSRSLPFLSVAP